MVDNNAMMGASNFAKTNFTTEPILSESRKNDNSRLFSQSDLKVAVLQLVPNAATVHGQWTDGKQVIPTLSFSFENGVLRFIKSPMEHEWLRNVGDDWRVSIRENYRVYYKDLDADVCDFDNISGVLSQIAANSINAFKKRLTAEDSIRTKINGVMSKLDTTDLLDLLRASVLEVRKDMLLKLSIVRLRNEGNTLRATHIPTSLSVKADRPRHFDEEFLAEVENSFSTGIPVLTCNSSCQGHLAAIPVRQKNSFNGEKYFLLSKSTTGFTREDMFLLNTFAKSFEDIFQKNTKLKLLIRLRKEIRFKSFHGQASNYKELEQNFLKFMDGIIQEIFKVIPSCHSLTIRTYDPQTNSLKLLVDGKPHGNSEGENRHEEIGLREKFESVNAFTYTTYNSDVDYVYIRNTREPIPREYSELGLYRIISRREQTLSELCFPFFFSETVIGTINLEAREKRAFDEDLEYLYALKHTIEEKYRSLFSFSDVNWIRQLSKVTDPLHEIVNHLESDFFNAEQKELLQNLLISPVAGTSGGVEDVRGSELLDLIGKRVDKLYPNEECSLVSSLKGMVRLSGAVPTRVGADIFEGIWTIIRNLMSNTINHSPIFRRDEKYIISDLIRIDFGRRESRRDEIRVKYITYGLIPEEVAETAGLMPIESHDAADKPLHFGLYGLGLITRALGGYMTLSLSKCSRYDVVEFLLPRE
ncbi:hypothetical protein [Falsiphaeobacter marinintestinus]|uniref:hypothetical protein n=1 Tax=Falsiphaeobacter marinintestinus TaxID=1492905 RepID=UPI0011B5FA74|nr:hypothetical protein [Phaeobacter marinintestinus]